MYSFLLKMLFCNFFFSDINSKHLFHMVLESGKPKIKLARDSVYEPLPGLQTTILSCVLVWLFLGENT